MRSTLFISALIIQLEVLMSFIEIDFFINPKVNCLSVKEHLLLINLGLDIFKQVSFLFKGKIFK